MIRSDDEPRIYLNRRRTQDGYGRRTVGWTYRVVSKRRVEDDGSYSDELMEGDALTKRRASQRAERVRQRLTPSPTRVDPGRRP